jgi:ABC-2 type transport system permease protein
MMRVARRFSLPRLLTIARKETIQLRRDPRSLGMAFGVPAILLVLFSTVIRFDVTDIPLAVLDRDGSQPSRALVSAFTASGYFTLTAQLGREHEAGRLLTLGRARMVLIVPPGFARELAAGRPAPVQALVDGSDANTAQIALNYARAIVTSHSARAVLRGVTLPPPVTAQARVWYNEELRSTNMIVPGLIAVIMMVIASMLTALTVAREWERGTMEQLAATPVHRGEVIIGKLLPYLAIGLIDIAVAVAVGVVVFQVPLRGNLPYLLSQAFLFLCGALGLGIAISAAVKSQLLATQAAMVATYLPALLLSGLMFDIAAMPLPLRVVSLLVPARYFIVVTRGVFLKGVGPSVLWMQSLAMVAFAIVGIGLAVKAFKKETG